MLCVGYTLVGAANFTAGNILALRVTSPSALSSAATAIVLEELNSTTGALVQPVITVSDCTISGTSTLQGQLSLSPDGANSAFACFGAAVGSSDPTVDGTKARGAVIFKNDATLSTFSGFAAAYQSPARGVYSAVVASASGNFYIGGDGGNVRGAVGRVSGARFRPALSRPLLAARLVGLSYSVGPGQITTAINTIQSRKATVFGNTLYVAGPLGPGPGVHQVRGEGGRSGERRCDNSAPSGVQVGAAGSPPITASSETLITTSTTSSAVYGTGASVASYFFQVGPP